MVSIIFIVVAVALFASLMIPRDDKPETRCRRGNIGSLLGGLAIVVSRKKSGLNSRLLCALRSVVSF